MIIWSLIIVYTFKLLLYLNASKILEQMVLTSKVQLLTSVVAYIMAGHL